MNKVSELIISKCKKDINYKVVIMSNSPKSLNQKRKIVGKLVEYYTKTYSIEHVLTRIVPKLYNNIIIKLSV